MPKDFSAVALMISRVTTTSSTAAHQGGFFSQTFGQELVSGLIAGFVTGLVVGLAVLLVQRHLDDRRERMRIDREVATIWTSVLDAADRPASFIIGSASDSVPPAATEIAGVIAGQPIGYWLDKDSASDSIKKLNTFSLALRRFQRDAAKLDSALWNAVRIYNATLNMIAVNDREDVKYFMGRTQGFSDEALAPHLMMGEPNVSPRLHTSFEAISQDDAVIKAVPAYTEARDQLVAAVAAIRQN
jgi:hypothetical protein